MKEEKDILKTHVTDDFNQITPSTDFTKIVMQKVEISLNTQLVVKPLISKRFWKYLILGAVLLLVLSIIIEMPKYNINWYNKYSLELPKLSDFKTSIKLFFTVVFILLSLTIADVFYRKIKN